MHVYTCNLGRREHANTQKLLAAGPGPSSVPRNTGGSAPDQSEQESSQWSPGHPQCVTGLKHRPCRTLCPTPFSPSNAHRDLGAVDRPP